MFCFGNSLKKSIEICSIRNHIRFIFYSTPKYSLQGTTQGRYLTGGVPPVRFSM